MRFQTARRTADVSIATLQDRPTDMPLLIYRSRCHGARVNTYVAVLRSGAISRVKCRRW